MQEILVPTKENYEEALERILDVYGKSGVSLSECLDTDSVALSAGDLKYFDKKWYGKVPSYSVFVRYLDKLPADVRDKFMGLVNEIESGRYSDEMAKVARGTFVGPDEVRRFGMYKELNKVAERRIDRIDKRIASRDTSAERGADLALRIISALSDKELLKIKGDAETIDAEYRAIEVVK